MCGAASPPGCGAPATWPAHSCRAPAGGAKGSTATFAIVRGAEVVAVAGCVSSDLHANASTQNSRHDERLMLVREWRSYPAMMKVGLCGFTIAAEQYYRLFPVLEIQQTFYDPPPIATIQRWRDEAPADFEFTLKAWQVITHAAASRTYRRMKRAFSDRERQEFGNFRVNETTRRALDVSLEAAATLRATAMLFQCPPSFRPTDENLANMRQFFAASPRPEGLRFLWEPRGAWPDEVIASVCRDCDLAHVVDPFLRDTVTPSPLTYWRLHGKGSHYRAYTEDELAELFSRVPKNAETYVMFNNIPRVNDAKRFLSLDRNA